MPPMPANHVRGFVRNLRRPVLAASLSHFRQQKSRYREALLPLVSGVAARPLVGRIHRCRRLCTSFHFKTRANRPVTRNVLIMQELQVSSARRGGATLPTKDA